jgi:NADH dehydrogenase FAD-containing subunit
LGASLSWKSDPIEGYRFVIIEAKSHYNHVYAFPRAAIVPGFERELFVPYDNFFPDEKVGKVIQARATAIHKDHVELDRDVTGFGKSVPYEYLIYSAGTTIPAPGRFNVDSKKEGIEQLKKYQEVIRESQKPIVIGAGAVGLGKKKLTPLLKIIKKNKNGN